MSYNSNEKRILIWSASYPPVLGGLQSVVSDLATGLQRDGHLVRVLTNKIPSSLSSREIINEIPVARYRFFHLIRPVHSIGDVAVGIYSILMYPVRVVQVINMIRRFSPHVVNVHFPSQQIWFVGVLKKIFSKTKWIISLHGDDILQFFEYNQNGNQTILKCNLSLVEKIKLNVLKQCIVQANIFTTCSDYLMNMTCSMFRSGIANGQVLYNGIDFGTFSSPRNKLLNQDYIVATGRLVYVKGFDILISAFSKLPEYLRMRYTLIIAGSGIEKERLESQVIELKIQNRVIFYGRASQSEIASLLQHCSLAVVPSRTETFGIALIESMAAGAKVLATDIGGIPEIAQFGPVSLCRPNPRDLSEKMNEILIHQDPFIEIDKTVLEKIFSKDLMLKKFSNILFS